MLRLELLFLIFSLVVITLDHSFAFDFNQYVENELTIEKGLKETEKKIEKIPAETKIKGKKWQETFSDKKKWSQYQNSDKGIVIDGKTYKESKENKELRLTIKKQSDKGYQDQVTRHNQMIESNLQEDDQNMKKFHNL